MEDDNKKYFSELKLQNWTLDKNEVKGPNSGQASISYVTNNEGKKGVFRLLKKKTPKNIQRFKRELKILIDQKYRHPNIVNILDYPTTSDQYWYISERGSPISPFRKRLKEKYKESPNQYCLECIRLIIDLLKGLSILHKQDIVHRDIKPQNIVVNVNKLVLIDFGLAYERDEERISDLDESTGNRAFSHDRQRYYLENPKPWFDVFMVSQLLIWFLDSNEGKYWSRPLDWRYVKYINGLSNHFSEAVRAVTAVCSEEITSPSSAKELIQLLQSLFPIFETSTHENTLLDISTIKEGLSKGKSKGLLIKAKDQEIIKSSFPIADQISKEILDYIQPIFNKLSNEVPAQCNVNGTGVFKQFYKLLFNDNPKITTILYEYQMGDFNKRSLMFRIILYTYLPSYKDQFKNDPKLPSTSNMFVLYLQLYSENQLINKEFVEKKNIITIEKNGTLCLRDKKMNQISTISIDGIGSLVAEWITDSKNWELIQVTS